jgi:hypothetical protein
MRGHTLGVTGPAERAALASTIAGAARLCRRVFTQYTEMHGMPSAELNRWALFAIALLEATESSGAALEDSDLRRIRDAASAAAAVSRTQLPSETALALSDAFSDAEWICAEGLGGVGVQHSSQRFLFSDADVTVTHIGMRWRVRSGAIEFEDPLLDRALALACSWLSSGRIGELALQILDWDAHARPQTG